jgi:hypothetical protein
LQCTKYESRYQGRTCRGCLKTIATRSGWRHDELPEMQPRTGQEMAKSRWPQLHLLSFAKSTTRWHESTMVQYTDIYRASSFRHNTIMVKRVAILNNQHLLRSLPSAKSTNADSSRSYVPSRVTSGLLLFRLLCSVSLIVFGTGLIAALASYLII